MANHPVKQLLYDRIIGLLRQEVLGSCAPGQRLDSINKLAKRFAVSETTLRMALLALQQEGVIELRQGSGCYVTGNRPVQHLGIFIDWDVSRPNTSYFWLRVIHELRPLLEAAGFPVHTYVGHVRGGEPNPGPSCPEFLEAVEQNKLCGVVSLAGAIDPRWMGPLEQRQVPVVGLGFFHYPYNVTMDIVEMVRAGVRHLLGQGRRKLAYLGYGGGPLTAAFRAMLQEAGVAPHDSWIRSELYPGLAGAGWEELRAIWFAGEEKPDGLLVSDDMLFRDAQTAILEFGVRVPGQLLVVTHANKGSGIRYSFPVVQLEFDPDEVARAMGQLLVRLVRREPGMIDQVIVPFRLQPARVEETFSDGVEI